MLTYHPQPYGGVQIRDDGRTIGCVKNKALARELCDEINRREAERRPT